MAVTAVAKEMGRWCNGEAFAHVERCWAAIPAEKLPAMQGAWAVLKAVDSVSMPPLDEDFAARVARGEDMLTDEETRRLVFWRAGHAHALLCAAWGFADMFCSGSVDRAMDLCEKAEEWFSAKGLRDKGSHEPLKLAYAKALKNHRSGIDMERHMRESAGAHASARR